VERFSRPFIVRWADCDANGHLRNTCYSEYAIEVRMAFLGSHGFGLPEFRAHGVGPVLLREEIDYLRECHMGEEVTVDFRSLGLSPDGTRFKGLHEFVKPDGKLAARLVIFGGWLDLAARRLGPPPQAIKETFERVQRGEPFLVLPPAGEKWFPGGTPHRPRP
jgi:acyl-CoA thioester hydrolase